MWLSVRSPGWTMLINQWQAREGKKKLNPFRNENPFAETYTVYWLTNSFQTSFSSAEIESLSFFFMSRTSFPINFLWENVCKWNPLKCSRGKKREGIRHVEQQCLALSNRKLCHCRAGKFKYQKSSMRLRDSAHVLNFILKHCWSSPPFSISLCINETCSAFHSQAAVDKNI